MSREARERLEELQMKLRELRGSGPPEALRTQLTNELARHRVDLEKQVDRARRQVRSLERQVELAAKRPLAVQPSRIAAVPVLAPLYLVVAAPLAILAVVIFDGLFSPGQVLLGVAGVGALLAWNMLRSTKNETAAAPKSSGR